MQVKEQWIVTINRKENVFNGYEKEQLERGMKIGDKWFKNEKGEIFSIPHIESIVLHSREIENQLPEGEKVSEPTLSKEELHERIQRLKKLE